MSLEADRCVLFDWGDTLMRVFPEFGGPMARWPRLQVMPHAKETLAALWPRWVIGLATNAVDSSAADIREALALVGLGGYVDRVYRAQEVGCRKPSPGFFKFVLGDLGLEPSRVVMVGDDYDQDVLGANVSGIRAVWFNPGSRVEKCGEMRTTIHDLRNLYGILCGWGLAGDVQAGR